MKSLITALVILLTASHAVAQPSDLEREIAKCAAIAGELERLSCYDDLAERAGLDGLQNQSVEIEGTGKWVIRRDVNPIDDSERVILRLTADKGKSSYGKSVVFVARCKSNKTEAYINWNNYLGDDSNDVYNDWKYVTIRIGGKKSQKQRWGISTDNEATFAPDWAGNLLKEMSRSNKFLAQVTPYGESPVTAIFDTTGMAKALQPLAETCGWSLD